jgi:hypothetical protein
MPLLWPTTRVQSSPPNRSPGPSAQSNLVFDLIALVPRHESHPRDKGRVALGFYWSRNTPLTLENILQQYPCLRKLLPYHLRQEGCPGCGIGLGKT